MEGCWCSDSLGATESASRTIPCGMLSRAAELATRARTPGSKKLRGGVGMRLVICSPARRRQPAGRDADRINRAPPSDRTTVALPLTTPDRLYFEPKGKTVSFLASPCPPPVFRPSDPSLDRKGSTLTASSCGTPTIHPRFQVSTRSCPRRPERIASATGTSQVATDWQVALAASRET